MADYTASLDGLPFRLNDPAGNQSVLTGGQTLYDDAGNKFTISNPLPVGGSYPVNFTATIANGASLSGAVDLGRAVLSAVIMPAGWTAADLTFQVSADNATFVDLYDGNVERVVTGPAASRALNLSLDWSAYRYVKVRSGTAAAAVNQGASRALTLVGVV